MIYRKSEKNFINYKTFHVGRTKLRELWSTNKKVIGVNIDPLKWTFFEILHFGP